MFGYNQESKWFFFQKQQKQITKINYCQHKTLYTQILSTFIYYGIYYTINACVWITTMFKLPEEIIFTKSEEQGGYFTARVTK